MDYYFPCERYTEHVYVNGVCFMCKKSELENKMKMVLARRNMINMTYHLTAKEDGTVLIQCMDLNKSIIVQADIDELNQGWYHWLSGEYIQNAFPMLSADEREFLLTGITSEEWNELFPDEDEQQNGNSN